MSADRACLGLKAKTSLRVPFAPKAGSRDQGHRPESRGSYHVAKLER